MTMDLLGKTPSGITRDWVAKLADAAYVMAGGRGEAHITISVVGDAAMRKLNYRHRGIERTTDVLSFVYDDKTGFPNVSEDNGNILLGEIVISAPQVRRQAKSAERPVRTEFALMVVHGVLHLLGYDHATSRQEAEMFSLQQDILIKQRIL